MSGYCWCKDPPSDERIRAMQKRHDKRAAALTVVVVCAFGTVISAALGLWVTSCLSALGVVCGATHLYLTGVVPVPPTTTERAERRRRAREAMDRFLAEER